MYKGPVAAFMPQGPEEPWSGPALLHSEILDPPLVREFATITMLLGWCAEDVERSRWAWSFDNVDFDLVAGTGTTYKQRLAWRYRVRMFNDNFDSASAMPHAQNTQ